jgi:tetratricopeptide (TPR) repeat protein
MKPFLAFILLTVCGAVLSSCTTTGPTIEPSRESEDLMGLVKSVQQSVVTVQTFDENMTATGLGTGFFINEKGHLITNYHVLDGAFAANVKTAGGKTFSVDLMLAENQSVDLVKVAVDVPRGSVDGIGVTGDVPAIAERIIVVGSPLGLEQTVSEGIVSAIRELPGSGKIFQMSAPIARGSSGSPVINLSGQVIGVVSFQSLAGQNINFAVAGKGVVDLINDSHPVSLGEWTYANSRKKPELAKALCRSGYQFSIKGQYKEALSYYLEATEQKPDDSEAWYGLGHCYVGLERSDEAIHAYREVIRTDPDNPLPYYNLGRYFAELGDLDEAAGAFQEAVEVDSNYIPAIFDLAVVFGRLGKIDDELHAYERVIAINPRFYPAHYQMGLAYLRAGRYADALRAQKNALELNAEFAPAHVAIGVIWHQLDDREKARTAYRNALKADPDLADAHFRMGLLALETGDRELALQQYKVLKTLNKSLADRLFDRIY